MRPEQDTSFFRNFADDCRLTPAHVSLYTSLYHLWRENNFLNPVPISRRKVMPIAKIKAYFTYHKCIQELVSFGYITYHPTHNYVTANTLIYIIHC
jgi:hypothetical protein